MATTKGIKDNFANKMFGTVTESAANTLTFGEINTQVSLMDRVAFVIHRIEWYLTDAVYNLVVAANDWFTAALVTSNKISSIALDNPAVVDMFEHRIRYETSVGFQKFDVPITRDFTSLPGGGLIVAPRPLYVAVKGSNLASAGGAQARISFTVRAVSDSDYYDLLDIYRIIQ